MSLPEKDGLSTNAWTMSTGKLIDDNLLGEGYRLVNVVSKKKGKLMTDIGQYYHVLNRGNEKQEIFYDAENYYFFLRQLGKYLKLYGPTLVAYCLMPNHFHLIMHENGNDGIPRCMHALQTSFSKAVNEK